MKTDQPFEYQSIVVSGRELPVENFLHYCVSGNAAIFEGIDPIELSHSRANFIQSGLDALLLEQENDKWLQINIDSRGVQQNIHLYNVINELFKELTAQGYIKNAFFMHKSPGMRVRFQMVDESTKKMVARQLQEKVHQWQLEERVDTLYFSQYEPEATLFGGSQSIAFVHQLFSIDSEFWLQFHAGHYEISAGRNLELSLYILRNVFLSLEIVDWEDLEVWRKVRSRAGRILNNPSLLDQEILNSVQSEIVQLWANPLGLLEGYPQALREDLGQVCDKLGKVCHCWLKSYFHTTQAKLGVRAAAAAYVIFFWNRAGIPIEQQMIVTHVLNKRKVFE